MDLKILAALHEDGVVYVSDAEPGEQYHCLGCGNRLKVNRAHERDGIAVQKHYSHLGDSCGHESETHVKMKGHTGLVARDLWPDAEVTVEGPDEGRIDVGARHHPDVLVEFDEPREPWGEGICFECQHANESKDMGAAERDYLVHGYSTAWTWSEEPLSLDHFETTKVWNEWAALMPDHGGRPRPEWELEQAVVPVTLPDEMWPRFVPHEEPETHDDLLPGEPDLAVVPVTTVPEGLPEHGRNIEPGEVTYWGGYDGACGACGADIEEHDEKEAIVFKHDDETVYTECLRELEPSVYDELSGRYGVMKA